MSSPFHHRFLFTLLAGALALLAAGCSHAGASSDSPQDKMASASKAIQEIQSNPTLTQAQKDETVAKIKASQGQK